MVEMHHSIESPLLQNAQKILTWAEKFGYSTWSLRYKERITLPQELQGKGKSHLLLLPVGHSFPHYLS